MAKHERIVPCILVHARISYFQLPYDRQIGISGATLIPKFYLAGGMSGAPQHVDGMQGTEMVVATRWGKKGLPSRDENEPRIYC